MLINALTIPTLAPHPPSDPLPALPMCVQHVLEGMLVLPNAFTIPILPNFGLPLPPKGALSVTLLRAEGIRGSLVYCKLAVRKDRPMAGHAVKVVEGKAEFNEEFNFIVGGLRCHTYLPHLLIGTSRCSP
jgi:hypothetical protein